MRENKKKRKIQMPLYLHDKMLLKYELTNIKWGLGNLKLEKIVQMIFMLYQILHFRQ